jgi:hypothetical protein
MENKGETYYKLTATPVNRNTLIKKPTAGEIKKGGEIPVVYPAPPTNTAIGNSGNSRTHNAKKGSHNTTLQALRTYETDAYELIKRKKTSMVDIALAEEKKRRQRLEANKAVSQYRFSKNALAIIISSILIVTALGSVLVVRYLTSQEKIEPTEQIFPAPLVFSEFQKEIELTGMDRDSIIRKLRQVLEESARPLNSITHLYFTEAVGNSKSDNEPRRVLVNSDKFLIRLRVSAPSSFLRALEPNFTFGIHMFDGNQPFLILKTRSFENAFAGMLSWENDLLYDLGPIFTPQRDVKQYAFEDLVIKNRDARVVRDKPGIGRIIFLYTFFDKETIIITTTERTLEELILRMTSLRSIS